MDGAPGEPERIEGGRGGAEREGGRERQGAERDRGRERQGKRRKRNRCAISLDGTSWREEERERERERGLKELKCYLSLSLSPLSTHFCNSHEHTTA
jgi:hypothetical protein